MTLHLISEGNATWPSRILRWIGEGAIQSQVLIYPHPALLTQIGSGDQILISSSLVGALTKVLDGRYAGLVDGPPLRLDQVITIGDSDLPNASWIPTDFDLGTFNSATERSNRASGAAKTPFDTFDQPPHLDPQPEQKLQAEFQDYLDLNGYQRTPMASSDHHPYGNEQFLYRPQEQTKPEPTKVEDLTGSLSPPSPSGSYNTRSAQPTRLAKESDRAIPSGRSVQRNLALKHSRTKTDRYSLPRFISVVGPGGTGSSTVAMAVSQVVAQIWGDCTLVDAKTRGELAFLNEAGLHRLGINELITASRIRDLTSDATRAYLEPIEHRGYSLLKASSNPRAWIGWDPGSIESAFASLSNVAPVVCDINTNIYDLVNLKDDQPPEREMLTYECLLRSDLVLIVGSPDTKGIYSIAEQHSDIEATRTVPVEKVVVINRVNQGRMQRHIAENRLRSLLEANGTPQYHQDRTETVVVSLPDRNLERTTCDVTALPRWLCDPFERILTSSRDRQPSESGQVLQATRRTKAVS